MTGSIATVMKPPEALSKHEIFNEANFNTMALQNAVRDSPNVSLRLGAKK